MEYRVGLDHGRRFRYRAHGQGGCGKVRGREKDHDWLRDNALMPARDARMAQAGSACQIEFRLIYRLSILIALLIRFVLVLLTQLHHAEQQWWSNKLGYSQPPVAQFKPT